MFLIKMQNFFLFNFAQTSHNGMGDWEFVLIDQGDTFLPNDLTERDVTLEFG